MTLFWAQVTLMLLATFFHCLGRVYELRYHQHMHYLAKWDKEFTERLYAAYRCALAGDLAKANEHYSHLRYITNKYVMFFDSIN